MSRAPRDLYSIYALDQPLAPGDVLTLTFSVGHESRGFRDGNELAQFAYNGTFFDTEFFPAIGYDPAHQYNVDEMLEASRAGLDYYQAHISPYQFTQYRDIGVFKGTRDEETPIYMHREKITQCRQTFNLVVDERPTLAGIDPYNKLIDRIADDNVMDVAER